MSDNDDDKRAEERDEAETSDDSTERASEESETREDAAPAEASSASSGSDDDDASSDDEDEAESAAAPAAASGDAKRMSAGARLAAAKAAKAVAKAAQKQERKASQTQVEAQPEAPTDEEAPAAETDPLHDLEESELGRAALRAGKWWESNQQMGWIAVGVAALAILGFLGFTYQRDSTSAAAGTLLETAVETASARIVPEGEEPAAEPDDEGEGDDGDEEERTFPTRAARDEAALEAYQAVITQYPTHAAAGMARLGAARALLALGRNDEAQAMYQEAFDHGASSPVVAWQALEGVGFAQEAAGHADEARETYERLGNIDNHAYQQVSSYHLARLMLARGERDEARNALRELVDSLRADTVEDSSEPRFPYLLSQAEIRLRELDPSSATSAGPQLLGPGGPGGGGGAGGGGAGGEGQIDPAQLQELIRQFQARQQQGGGGEGGEGGGE